MKDTRLDVSRESVLRLRDAAIDLVQRVAKDLPGAPSLYREGWHDGYLRAVEHILEMENE